MADRSLQQLAQMPLRSYSRTEFTALRARVQGLAIEMIERHYGTLLDGASAGIASRLAAFEAQEDTHRLEGAE